MVTLVLGAGASIDICKEFKSGAGLLSEIKQVLHPETYLHQQLISDLNITPNSIITFINDLNAFESATIINKQTPSIDSFRNMFKKERAFEKMKNDYDWISKMAIMYCILHWEKSYKNKIDNKQICFRDNWVNKIANYLISPLNTKYGELNIVTYNYDRLLEYILNLHGYIDNSQDLVFWKRIIHIYGSIDIDKVQFGLELNSLSKLKRPIEDFHTVHDFKINLYNDLHSHWSTLKRPILANRYINESKKVFILGFGFDHINCQRIGLTREISHKLVGNIFYESSANICQAESEVTRVKSILPDIKITHLSCSDFIDYLID